jgi:hypothetical protein
MRVYYIAYDYGYPNLDVEMLDGPFGTHVEANNVRESMVLCDGEDDKLIIVQEYKEVVTV